MVSTRQMCGSAASGAGSTFAPPLEAASTSGSSLTSNVVSQQGAQDPESTGARTSVLRRTANYNNNPSQSQLSSPATLAFSASVVTRHHSYNMQIQRSTSDRMRPAAAAPGGHVTTPKINLLDLPNELIEKTLSYLDYKKISNLRLVSAAVSARPSVGAIKSIKSNLKSARAWDDGRRELVGYPTVNYLHSYAPYIFVASASAISIAIAVPFRSAVLCALFLPLEAPRRRSSSVGVGTSVGAFFPLQEVIKTFSRGHMHL